MIFVLTITFFLGMASLGFSEKEVLQDADAFDTGDVVSGDTADSSEPGIVHVENIKARSNTYGIKGTNLRINKAADYYNWGIGEDIDEDASINLPTSMGVSF